ncbi:protein trc8-like protein [Lasius niger]|uniref:Protein trc8-like protein n=1 Tax=Lasius niger TaxID=67767 RepID=A0A0J7KKV4_LASNI|nr:protein trc8-like protein [Lasius niger]
MEIRERILSFADVIMRVPPLFIIDELLRIGLGLPNDNIVLDSTENGFKTTNVGTIVNSISAVTTDSFLIEQFDLTRFTYKTYLIIIFKFLSCCLDVLYNGPGLLIIQNYILQCLLASIFCYIHLAPRHPVVQKLLVLSFMSPSILGIHPLPVQYLYHAPVCATLIPLAVCKFIIWYNGISMLRTIYIAYRHARNFIINYGLSALAETEWMRLNVPCVLRTFWMLRVGEQVIQILGNHYGEETFNYYVMVRTLLVNGCETLTAVLVSTWLLAVSVFSIEVIVKVLVSLAIYSLFLIDAYRSAFWEQFDDCVYIIRSFGNTVEFAFGIILFFNGFWILVFESGGAIRAIMMCIHAYFNIWCEAKAGWSVFMKRRTAVNKINSLPEAKIEQLEKLDDVCAICYQEMQSAKITQCNHYFHGVCLRKWLYVQDRCPLCHDILYKVENVQSRDNDSLAVDEDRRNDIEI